MKRSAATAFYHHKQCAARDCHRTRRWKRVTTSRSRRSTNRRRRLNTRKRRLRRHSNAVFDWVGIITLVNDTSPPQSRNEDRSLFFIRRRASSDDRNERKTRLFHYSAAHCVGKCDGSGKRATSVDEEPAASAWKRFRHLGGRYDVLSVFWFSSASEIRAMKPLLSRWWHEWKIRASSSANTRGTSSCSQSASVAYAPPQLYRIGQELRRLPWITASLQSWATDRNAFCRPMLCTSAAYAVVRC